MRDPRGPGRPARGGGGESERSGREREARGQLTVRHKYKLRTLLKLSAQGVPHSNEITGEGLASFIKIFDPRGWWGRGPTLFVRAEAAWPSGTDSRGQMRLAERRRLRNARHRHRGRVRAMRKRSRSGATGPPERPRRDGNRRKKYVKHNYRIKVEIRATRSTFWREFLRERSVDASGPTRIEEPASARKFSFPDTEW